MIIFEGCIGEYRELYGRDRRKEVKELMNRTEKLEPWILVRVWTMTYSKGERLEWQRQN